MGPVMARLSTKRRSDPGFRATRETNEIRTLDGLGNSGRKATPGHVEILEAVGRPRLETREVKRKSFRWGSH